jgi:DNA-directed RNA polymerase specialized sigma subunit
MENRINYGDYIIDDRNNKLYKNNERKQEYEEIIKNFKTFCNKSINKDILIDYYVNNLSQKDVSKKYNISRTKVSDILKNDIKLFKHYYIDNE